MPVVQNVRQSLRFTNKTSKLFFSLIYAMPFVENICQSLNTVFTIIEQ